MGKKRPTSPSTGITDPRFAQIATDPRFRTAPSHVQEFAADERFSSMFTDSSFQGPAAPKVDARGKPVTSVKNNLAKLYGKKGGCLDEEGRFRWEEVSSSEEEVDVEEAGVEDTAEDLWSEKEAAPEGDPTARFAVMNLDWSGITAIDLLALFRSFCPDTGSVLSVSIYPSQFGHERLLHEAIEGPATDIYDPSQENGLDEVKLRKYEKERMRYYYAVAVCDSVATAEGIYKDCEGLEIERTSNVIDLRYIPDSLTEFPYPAKEVVESIPKSYSLKDFFTRALQHSRVKLTWDETPLERTQTLKKAFTEEDMEKMDLNEYLAPDSSSNEEDLEEDKDHIEDRESDSAEEPQSRTFQKVSQFNRQKKDDIDLEITFNTAFDDISERAKAPRSTDESVWEKHEREHSERKRQTHSQKLKEKSRAKKLSKKEKATLSLLVDDSQGGKYQFDPEDARFQPVFSDPQYAVDPTNPKFKRDAEANEKVLEVQRKKRKLEQ